LFERQLLQFLQEKFGNIENRGVERFLLNPTVLFENTADLEEEGKTYLNFHKDFDELILRYESQLKDKFSEITDGMLSSQNRRKLDKSIRYHTQLIRSENDEPSMVANRSISLDIQQDEGEKSVNNDDTRLILADLIDSISMLGETTPGNNSVSPIYCPTSTLGSRAGEVTNLTPVNAQNYLSPFNIRNNALAEFQPPSPFVIYDNLLADYLTPVSSPTPGRLPATPRQIPSPATPGSLMRPRPLPPPPALTRGRAREDARLARNGEETARPPTPLTPMSASEIARVRGNEEAPRQGTRIRNPPQRYITE
jgi:hypothetical protein